MIEQARLVDEVLFVARDGSALVRRKRGEDGLAGSPKQHTPYRTPPPLEDAVLVHVVETSDRQIALLDCASVAGAPDHTSINAALFRDYDQVVWIERDQKGLAMAALRSRGTPDLASATLAIWALKVQGGWDESPLLHIWVRASHQGEFSESIHRVDSGFDSTTKRWSARLTSSRDDAPLAKEIQHPKTWLVTLNIDRFMIFNDAYGHVEGDFALLQILHALELATDRRVCLRRAEFEVVANGSAANARNVAEALRKDVEDLRIPLEHDEAQTLPFVTVSAGVVAGDRSLELARRDVRDAIEEAKARGRNQVCLLAAS